MKLLRFFLLLFFFALVQNSFAQGQAGYVFVVKIAPSWSSLVTYYEAFYNGRNFSESRALTKNQFVLRAAGIETSLANAEKKNLWDEYGIYYLGQKKKLLSDTVSKSLWLPHSFPVPPILDSLWKLRFAVYPYKTDSQDTLGWTMNFKNIYVPTHAQKVILAQMGMDTVYYTIWGDNIFHLLKAMQDPQWVQNYKNAGNDTKTSTTTH